MLASLAPDPNDDFGSDVAVSGTTVVVGSRFEDSAAACGADNSTRDSGAAHVFVKQDGTFRFQACLPGPAHSWFGNSVALAGDTLAVGAPVTSTVHVFTRTSGEWQQTAVLTPPDDVPIPPVGHLGFGEDGSLALSGDTLIVGARRANNLGGLAFIYVRTGGAWTYQATLHASNEVANANAGWGGAQFGYGVAVSGDTAIVGAHGEDGDASGVPGFASRDSGAAYIFVRSGSTWTQQAYLKEPTLGVRHMFAFGVAIDGDTALAGSADSGVHAFVRSGSSWNWQATLTTGGTKFALVGDTAYVGGSNVRAFTRSGGTWSEDAGRFGDFTCRGSCTVDASTTALVVGESSGGTPSTAPPGAAHVFEPVFLSSTPDVLRFHGVTGSGPGAWSAVTPPQQTRLSMGGSTVAWQATADAPWVQLSATSGVGDALLTVSIGNPGQVPGDATDVSANITITAPALNDAVTRIGVRLHVDRTGGASQPPLGQVDTPQQDATGVQGAISVTGWAIDDVGVVGVQIYRNCLAWEPAQNCQTLLGHSLVWIGDAVQVSGARPDVEAAFAGAYPATQRAGWGYLLLTSMLPHVAAEQAYGGVGPVTLYAIATDVEGHRTLLGRSSDPQSPQFTSPTSLTMANDTIARPFGTLDTPGQGATVSGAFPNFGWVLTPDTNRVGGEGGDVLIPLDGSTAVVFIDSVAVAQVTYNQCRGSVGNPPPSGVFCDDDVAGIFGNAAPQPSSTPRTSNPTPYRNLDSGRGAIGSYVVDTTTLSNGLHTIAWSVTDSQGRIEGIGSRFFNVVNGGSDAALRAAPAAVRGQASMLEARPIAHTGVWGRDGFDLAATWVPMHVNTQGVYQARLANQGRLELWLGAEIDTGYLTAPDGTLRDLPIGARLDGARFGWMPPVGYAGTYRLVFLRGHERLEVDVTVAPRHQVRPDEAQIRMHLDHPLQRHHPQGRNTLRVEGWAFDPHAAIEAGIEAVHVWAEPMGGVPDTPPSSPIFLGAARLDVARPDVSRALAGAPSHAGFALEATLPPGTYAITAYVWNTRTARWEDARRVVTTVR